MSSEKKLPRPQHPETPAEHATGAPEPAPPQEYDIDIYRAWCKKCGICVAFCPRECLAPDEEGAPQVVHPERCTGCGWCELHCPDFAISVRERWAGKEKEVKD
ncbi:MAG: 4Fe-4S binding protein [Desulfobaccales bacterium]